MLLCTKVGEHLRLQQVGLRFFVFFSFGCLSLFCLSRFRANVQHKNGRLEFNPFYP